MISLGPFGTIFNTVFIPTIRISIVVGIGIIECASSISIPVIFLIFIFEVERGNSAVVVCFFDDDALEHVQHGVEAGSMPGEHFHCFLERVSFGLVQVFQFDQAIFLSEQHQFFEVLSYSERLQ